MKKMVVFLSIAFSLVSCKDEFNIPPYGAVIDDLAPEITIISPPKDTTYIGQNIIPIEIRIKDSFSLDLFEFEISPETGGLQGLDFEKMFTTGDSTYTYVANYTVPSADSTTYEVYIRARDGVGNSDNEIYFITTK